MTSSIQKLIKITVLNWSVLNWKSCSSTSNLIWVTWNSGYILSNGAWTNSSTSSKQQNTNTASETSKELNTVTTSLVTTTTACITFTSFLNSSSITSLWLIVGQLQLFFLLLLTNAYIPIDVKEIITGPKFALNIYDFIPFKKMSIYPTLLKEFEFNVTNSMMNSFGLKYESTIANSFSFFACLSIIIILHMLVIVLKCAFSKCKDSNNCIIKIMNWIIKKVFNFMTFGYYIRNSMEISQFILVSSFYEIYLTNASESARLISLIFAASMIIWYVIRCISNWPYKLN